MSVFGTIITGHDVELAVKDTLQTWFPTYLAEIERITDRDPGELPNIRSWTSTNRLAKWPEDALPALVVVAPGITGDQPRAVDGAQYIATWAVGVAVITSGITREGTSDLSKLYAATVRAIMLQQQSLGGIAMGVDWTGEVYDDLPERDLRTLAAARLTFNVTVGDVVRGIGNGPIVPDLDPEDWATVASVDDVHVTINSEELA